MTIAVDYPTYSSARAHLRDVLDATARGRTVTLARDGELSAVMPVDRLRAYFFHTVSPRIRILREEGRTVALMEERPFVSEGVDVEAALDDLLLSLREYADDWEARLGTAPNHAQAWGLVQLIKLSTDVQLLDWFDRGGE